MKNFVLTVLILIALAFPSIVLAGEIFPFIQITNNGSWGVSEQLLMEVGSKNPNQAIFTFSNTGKIESSICDIYFYGSSVLSGFAAIEHGEGVSFDYSAKPPNLPGLNSLIADFSSDSLNPVVKNGVNPGEWIQYTFNLTSGTDLSDVIAALNNGSLRVGLHVQGISGVQDIDGNKKNNENYSESFLTKVSVPEPSLILLLGIGIGCASLGALRLRK
jgi:hypothetical protein